MTKDLQVQRIWRQWATLLLMCTVFSGLYGAWQGHQVAVGAQAQEQTVVLEEIAHSVAAQLVRVQSYGIPLEEAVGLDTWLASQTRTSAQVEGMAITLPSGKWLAGHGMTPDEPPSQSQAGGVRQKATGQLIVTLPITDASGRNAVATLRVRGSQPAPLWTAVLAGGAATVLAGLLGAWLLKAWLTTQLVPRLARIRQTLSDVTTNKLLTASIPESQPGRHDVALLDQTLVHQWRALRKQQTALLKKLNEVRAAHFDSNILARIDVLASPLLTLPETQASPSTQHTGTQTGWRQWNLGKKVSALLMTGWLISLLAALSLYGLEQRQHTRLRTAAQVERLQTAWQHLLQQEVAQLERWTSAAAVIPVVNGESVDIHSRLTEGVGWWLRTGVGTLHQATGGTAQANSEERRPPPLVDELLHKREAAQGLWLQAGDHSLQIGTGRALVMPDGTMAVAVASRSLLPILQRLAQEMGAQLALADHRGHPLDETSEALVHLWQTHHRLPVAPDQASGRWLLSVPLMSYTGHTLGHLVASLPESRELRESADSHMPSVWWLMTGCWLLLGGIGWYARQQLAPLAHAAQDLSRLAEIGTPATPGDVRLDHLTHDISALENQLDVLRTMRHSRERQGRRQARFIRHQMLELANRLDETARADVLKDLERIESASLHPTHRPTDTQAATEHNPRFERMVDEIGVLALGFQNLVGRVSDQYQQLGHLVQELREALRVKTQFIAIQQELEIARKMQLAFLPHNFAGQAGVDLHGITRPAKEVGGDFYDFFRLDVHHLGVLVADVSGKGIPAAFFMAVSRTLMRAVAQFSNGPGDCLQRLNDLLAADNDEMMFVTLFYGLLDTRTGTLRYANAGHNPPYVVRANGLVEPIASLGNMALAVMPGMDYEEGLLQLEAGDGLFMFTDGVTEAANPAGQWFGESRLEAWLATQSGGQNAEAVNRLLIDVVKQFEDGGAQSDDVTCMTVRFLPNGVSQVLQGPIAT